MLVHKVLDCVQVAISTGQREWGVTSLIYCKKELRLLCLVYACVRKRCVFVLQLLKDQL